MSKHFPTRGLLLACLPPIAMAVLLSPWWLLLLLIPAIAYLITCILIYRDTHDRRVRCGAQLETPDKPHLCPACRARLASRKESH